MNNAQHDNEYYNQVGNYFDLFAEKHHDKSDTNPILSEMRKSFRTFVKHNSPKKILDIGCGPGMDVAFFAKTYPKATVTGIDVSEKMLECAVDLSKSHQLKNTRFFNTGIEELHLHLDEGEQFDVIYVFFGALNTVNSLDEAAQIIDKLLAPKGTAVLTFVNKYYLSEFFVNMLKLRPGKATSRWKKTWRGYSNDVALSSNTYTPQQIQKAFTPTSLQFIARKGYSIFYPAWFQQERLKKHPRLCRQLKKMDVLANKSLLWSKGEYTLFVYNKH